MKRLRRFAASVMVLIAIDVAAAANPTKPQNPQPWFGMSVRPYRNPSSEPFLHGATFAYSLRLT